MPDVTSVPRGSSVDWPRDSYAACAVVRAVRPGRAAPRRDARRGRRAAAPACRPRGRGAVRRSAARRAGAAQREREPVPAVGRRGRERRAAGHRGGARAQPLPRPRVPGSARGSGRLLGRRVRGPARARAALGRERLQRGHAPAPPGLRRPGPLRPVVRAHVLDVPRVRARRDDRLGRGPARGGLHARPGLRGGDDRGGPARRDPAREPQQPDRHGAAARHGRGRARRRRPRRGRRRAGRVARGGRRRGLRRVPAPRRAERARAAGRPTEPRGRPHHVEGVRDGRRARRVPGGVAGAGRRAARRAAAVPPVGGDPGGRARGARALRRAHGPDRVAAGRA